MAESAIGSAEEEATKMLEEAERMAEARQKELMLEAKEEGIRITNEAEKEAKERRNEITRQERRLQQKEETLDERRDQLDKRQDKLKQKLDNVDSKLAEIEGIQVQQQDELEKISGLTVQEAKDLLLTDLRQEVEHESAMMIREIETTAKEEATKNARKILADAVGRCAVDHVTESCVSVVQLPNDEMKGRIIGREGRNIRALENLTGIDLIIDDTPEAVILSGFDAMRREIARIALEKLILDGRVHPARIEEMVEKATEEVEEIIKDEGESASFETGVHGLHPEMIRLLGKLKYRTSYGQNVLKHSIEVSHLAGLIAAEIGVDITLAKRAGLLHDIGKAIDHEQEGSHVTLGVKICKRYGENDVVINAVEAHHDDVEPNTIISVIVQAADAISAARPGARRETLESYIKRLEKLESIADEFDGVEKSFAIQAGREVRIMIIPEEVDDASMHILARDVAKKINSELEYPGEIKVNLIRETRAIAYA